MTQFKSFSEVFTAPIVRLLTGVAAAVAVGAVSSAARADTLIFDIFDSARFQIHGDVAPPTVPVELVDPQTHIVRRVEITSLFRVQGFIGIENMGTLPHGDLTKAYMSVALDLTSPDSSTALLNHFAIHNVQQFELPGPFDGILDFLGFSGRSFQFTKWDSQTVVFDESSPAVLALFQGYGQAQFPLHKSEDSAVNSTGTVKSQHALHNYGASILIRKTIELLDDTQE